MDLKKYIDTPSPIIKFLLELFNEYQSLTILDIGACEAEDSIKYSLSFPNSKIFAFEPLEQNFLKAKKNIESYKISNIELIQVALSNKKEFSDFYISSGHPENIEKTEEWEYGNKSSSLLAPDRVSENHKWLKFDNKIKIKTETLFNFCAENQIEMIDFIHLDVQGAELMVLEGAKKLIENIKVIWLEVELISLYTNQPLVDDIEKFMKKNGFMKKFEIIDTISGDQLYLNNKYFKKTTYLQRVMNQFNMKINVVENEEHKKFIKRSYSQCGEDLIVNYIFTVLNISKPSFVDIGAHHPYYLSNSALFYELGSEGINIEPDPILFKNFMLYRKRDINLNIGISDKEGLADFYIINVPTLNTFSKEEAERYKGEGNFFIQNVLKIKTNSLSNIIREHAGGVFPQFLNIDAEGVDELIINSIDFSNNYPLVICIETISFSTSGRGIKNTNLISKIENFGYLKYADTNINTIFVRKDLWEK